MNRSKAALVVLAALCSALLGASSVQAAVGPVYDVKAYWSDTNLPPGGIGRFALVVRNVGDQAGKEALIVRDELPEGVKLTDVTFIFGPFQENAKERCAGWNDGTEEWEESETLECEFSAAEVPQVIPAPGVEFPLSGGSAGYSPSPEGYLGFRGAIEVEVAIDPEASGSAVNTATVEGGGASTAATDVDAVPFSAAPSPFGLVPGSFAADVFDAAFPFGGPSRQAGEHPFEQRVDFDLNMRTGTKGEGSTPGSEPNAALKSVEVTLPPGLVGNPEATPQCDPLDFSSAGVTLNGTACPSNTQVGFLNISTTSNIGNTLANVALSRVPIYNLEPPYGVPADFGFNAGGLVQAHIYPKLDPAHDYAIKAIVPDISSLVPVRGNQATLWGVPGDPAHDSFRFYPEVHEEGGKKLAAGAPFGGAAIRPFFTLPMDCGVDNGGHVIRVDSYSSPGSFTKAEEHPDPLNVTGCDDPRFRFEPAVSLQPSSRVAGGPTGLDVSLHVPQRDDRVSDPQDLYDANGKIQGIGTPPVKKAVVTLPEGMTVSPSAAQGLATCTPEQIGLDTDSPVRCPLESQYGTLTLSTPILPKDEPLTGRVYVAQQGNHPFAKDTFLALYLVVDDPARGILVKVPGKVELDPNTGQIKTTFDDLPQFPLSEMEVSIKGGVRAGLVNPQTCGTKTIKAELYPWHDPSNPSTITSSYQVTEGPGGTPCPNSLSERPFDPKLGAGTLNPVAGAFSSLELQLTRTDAEQELSAVEGSAPLGLTASLRGIARCSDAQIAQAASRGAPGQGSLEINSSSCPASSQVGTVDAGAGVGEVLTYVKGKVYLAGPYKGAPLSGVAIVPAVAGPFDLGTIVTRAPAYVDPESAQIRLATDPLPQIVNGIPVRVRDIRVHMDRGSFILNPTSCEQMSFDGVLSSVHGARKGASERFQVGSCSDLGFKPRISLKLIGGTKRGSHPSLRAEVRPREGDANIGSAAVTLPRSAFLDQAHIRTICTRVQFAADACPAGSVYGHAAAFTPLLDEPLEGPVYLRSSNHNLPDLVVALKGPASLPVELNLAGRVDSVKGGIRNTFESTPDAPVSKFVLTMQGGKKGLVVNSRNLCAGTNRADARLLAHNGRRSNTKPKVVAVKCGKGREGKAGRR